MDTPAPPRHEAGAALATPPVTLLPLRQQADLTDAWLEERLAKVLPAVMAGAGIDLWIVSARESTEDPVMASLFPSTMLTARRRTILVFSVADSGAFEALAIARPGSPLDRHYRPVWGEGAGPPSETQGACLRRIVAERRPRAIGVDVSRDVALADGLTKSEHDALVEALGPELAARVVGAERLVVGWLERRIPAEIAMAEALNALAQAIIAEAFSARVVRAGVTAADDVVWWLRQRAHDLGAPAWFHPTVAIQRRGEDVGRPGATSAAIIEAGDLLHCDFGLQALGLATDTQHLAYVLRPGEHEPPAGLRTAMRVANDQQDLLAAAMIAGRTGNEVLADALARMSDAGITGRVYTHPIGFHGHGAGPVIGLYDQQAGVPVRGDFPLVDDTLFAFEMAAEVAVPEWDAQRVTMATEQTVSFRGGVVTYLGGRQTALHVIPSDAT
jgi:Xaa-Pro aminopeptidase